MKTFLYSILLLLLSLSLTAQNTTLIITGKNKQETQIIDSISYIKKHDSPEAAKIESRKIIKTLSKSGYLNLNSSFLTTKKQDTLLFHVELNQKIQEAHLYIDKNKINTSPFLKELKNDTLIIPFTEIENFLNKKYEILETSGKPFSKLRLINLQQKQNILIAELDFYIENKRTIDAIVFNYEDEKKTTQLPEGFQKFLLKKYKGKDYNKKTIEEIKNEINQIDFIKQNKYPEVLFKKDSTIVYTYLSKNNSNTFDGYIGFNNDENQKIKPSGYLNLKLDNILYHGEQFKLLWNNNGGQQKSFNSSLEIPFLFKTPISLKGELNIFTQDSIFQNTKTEIGIGYLLNLNSKISFYYTNTESSNTQNGISDINNLADFKTKFASLGFRFQKKSTQTFFSRKNQLLELILGYGTRNASTLTPQKQIQINTEYRNTFELNTKNHIYLRNYNFLLTSNHYLTNELFRFGGMNSIRGFIENNLQANYTSYLNTSYIYQLSPKIAVNSVIDFGIFQDKTNKTNLNKLNTIKSFGIEFNLETGNNNLLLSLVNGTIEDEKTNLYNTILTICYNVKF
ncbi:BamA/TamA family outer membrane protein [Flavobacterium agrisoli]|uniref:Outer membrane protein assembly factor BamA n=1 Tax=Flavobacterium agrisoli TaxID=2793066 RepID=A0A934PQ11_9FLAO|nr:hypothetical protein [Flavobacterium agrisoli]MBK0370955.1 hypothetical protein [Flavobacterium agrisoli]